MPDTVTETQTTDPSLISATPEPSWYTPEQADLVKQQGWTKPSDSVRDYGELLKSASGKVKIPTEESTEEERSNFYAKIRGVDKPEGYEVEVPEGVPVTDDEVNMLRKWAFETGTPKVAFESTVKKWLDYLADRRVQSRNEGEQTMKAEWKDNYGKNLEIARRFANEGGEEFIQLMDMSGLGNHPTMLRTMYNLGLKILSDSMIKGEPVTKESGPEWKPEYPSSPEMYVNMQGPDGERARAWFKERNASKGLF